MYRIFVSKKRLDRIGPYASSVGAFFGVFGGTLLPMFYGVYVLPGGFFSGIALAYIFCTCTHRRFFIFSYGALGAAIGAFIGYFVIGILLIPIYFSIGTGHNPPISLWIGPVFLHAIGVCVFTFFFSKYVCKKAQRKEMEVAVG